MIAKVLQAKYYLHVPSLFCIYRQHMQVNIGVALGACQDQIFPLEGCDFGALSRSGIKSPPNAYMTFLHGCTIVLAHALVLLLRIYVPLCGIYRRLGVVWQNVRSERSKITLKEALCKDEKTSRC